MSQKVWRAAQSLIALLAIAGIVYISGVYQYFFYQRTPPNIEQKSIARPERDIRVLALPLSVYILQSDAPYGSKRSEEDIRRLADNASRIWQQADIVLNVSSVQFLAITRDEYTSFLQTPISFIFDKGWYRETSINVFLVGTYGGVNGMSFGSLNSIAVADYTSVYDFRVLAHEIGHALGLRHVAGDKDSLMYKGANGFDLLPDEITQARKATKIFLNGD